MKQPFAVFDIDGTLFRSSLFLELSYRAVQEGLFPESFVSEISASREEWFKRNRSDSYKEYLNVALSLFVKNIAGVKASDLEKIAKATAKDMYEYTYVFTRDLLKDLKSKGYFLITLTGSPREVASAFTEPYGFDFVHSTILEAEDGYYTGGFKSGVINKEVILEKIISDYNLDVATSVGVGDSSKDAGFLKMVQKPIAFNPSSHLFEIAKDNNWRIVIERKNMIYHLEAKDGRYELAETNNR